MVDGSRLDIAKNVTHGHLPEGAEIGQSMFTPMGRGEL
jgi:hypothetical protein